jgi:hypothetical protein
MSTIPGISIPGGNSHGPFFITGHQPQLQHPGVWVKNVAVSNLARHHDGVGINFIVDNDLAGPSMIRVPAGPSDDPRFIEIPFDQPQATQPWEERHLADRSLFSSFAERIAAALTPWNIAPVLAEMWPDAMAMAACCSRIADCLSACRIAQERRWGLGNLELPISRLCGTEAFLSFTAHLCRDAARFRDAHNAAVHDYRQRYRVRNSRHPVPDLETRGALIEAPFWYWEAGATDRNRLFVRLENDRMELFAGDHFLFHSASIEDDVPALMRLQKQGRLRPRALSTTLFARLALADLFIHGIGGARYDEITDRLIASFFQCPVPKFFTLTATLRLPLPAFDVDSRDLEQALQQQRDFRFHAETFLDGDRADALRERKTELIELARAFREKNLPKSERRRIRGERRQWHFELKRVEEELADLAPAQQQRAAERVTQLRAALKANEVLKSREFAACLFPAEILRKLVDRTGRETCPPA